MFFRHDKACALATAAALTTSAWYILGNLVAFFTLKGWLPQAILMYAPQIGLMFQFVSMHGLMDENFAFGGFIIGLIQIFVTTALAVWVMGLLFERLYKKNQHNNPQYR